jgi:AcrR family transcriptional regulator
MQERIARQRDLKEFKRQKILIAAKECVSDNGISGTSMRAIAQGSGYSLGAAYAYFPSKEDIFAALLSSSFAELLRILRLELQQTSSGRRKINQAFNGFLRYFLSSKEEQVLLLTFYAGKNDNEKSLADDSFRQLNNRFLSVLGFLANTVHENGNLTAEDAQAETVQAVSFLLGVLIMNSSGQLRLIDQSPQEIVDRYLNQMLLRCDR